MLFLNTVTGEYPRHIGDLELLGWKQGEELPENWVEVEYATTYPEPGIDEVVFEDEPLKKNGKYYQNLKTRPMTAEEVERRDAPKRAKEKLLALGLTELEIEALTRGLVR